MVADGKPKRISRTRRIVGNSLGAALLLAALWAWLVEPHRLEITRHVVPADVSSPVKIAHLTDLHVHSIGRRERHVLESLAN